MEVLRYFGTPLVPHYWWHTSVLPHLILGKYK
jgi:hypothetical protein